MTKSLTAGRQAIDSSKSRGTRVPSTAMAMRKQSDRTEKDGAKVKARSAGQKLVAALDGELDERHRGGIQSIGRAFHILEEIARARDGIPLSELSKRVGLHNSTTFHLVKTMASLGYVQQVRDSKRYRIGRPLFALAASALDEIEMVNHATPILEDLSHESGESSHFAVRMGDAVMVVARTSGPSAFQLTDRVGVLRPAHCTALGKVILAALRPEQFERFLKRTELKAYSPKSVIEPEQLRREIAEVRRNGIAFDDGEFDAEVRCVAVPVLDFSGQVLGAIGVSGPVWRMSIQTLQSHARIVRHAAAELSGAFGFSALPPRNVDPAAEAKD